MRMARKCHKGMRLCELLFGRETKDSTQRPSIIIIRHDSVKKKFSVFKTLGPSAATALTANDGIDRPQNLIIID